MTTSTRDSPIQQLCMRSGQRFYFAEALACSRCNQRFVDPWENGWMEVNMSCVYVGPPCCDCDRLVAYLSCA